MNTYQRHKKWCAGFLAGYLVLALASALFTEKGEIYPFFNCHWFVHTPHVISDYGLSIKSWGDEKYDPPIYPEQMYGRFRAWAFAIYVGSQQYGEAIEQNDIYRTEQATWFFINNVFENKPVHFEVQKRVYNSVSFVHTGAITDAKIIKEVVRE